MADYYSNSLFTWLNITTPTVLKDKLLPWGELLVINPKGVLFISQTDLVKYLQIPVNASNLEKFPPFTPKCHCRACWKILIILQLKRNAIENARIDTINTINTTNTIDRVY